MKIIVTLSGNSNRFIKEGFVTKPLIKIDEKLVIEYVTSMFSDVKFEDFIFLVNDVDVKKYEIDKVLKNLYNKSKIYTISSHTKGPVTSILKITNEIFDDSPYIICYCDLTHKWNYKNFLNTLVETNCDGCLVTHVGMHPYRMRNINFAHLKVNQSKVVEVKEKGYYTDNPINEYASSGIYYFKSGKNIKYYFNKLVENKESVNGEYYVTLVYNEMIKDGLSIIHYPTDNYVCLGTPFDLMSFKYWKALIDTNMTNEEMKFIKDYWLRYHNYDL